MIIFDIISKEKQTLFFMIAFEVKKFQDFSVDMLYRILHLRAEVFVLEQQCIYQDVDFKDQQALHVLGYLQNELVAYARIYREEDNKSGVSIGRVLVLEKFRKLNYGHSLMNFIKTTIDSNFKDCTICISAQLYLISFYTSHGFVAKGEEYLEDGIPHIAMQFIKK